MQVFLYPFCRFRNFLGATIYHGILFCYHKLVSLSCFTRAFSHRRVSILVRIAYTIIITLGGKRLTFSTLFCHNFTFVEHITAWADDSIASLFLHVFVRSERAEQYARYTQMDSVSLGPCRSISIEITEKVKNLGQYCNGGGGGGRKSGSANEKP